MWFTETGLVARLLRVYQPQQPACLSSATIHAASFNGVITAFLVLAGEQQKGEEAVPVQWLRGNKYNDYFCFRWHDPRRSAADRGDHLGKEASSVVGGGDSEVEMGELYEESAKDQRGERK